jgi:hypothetical protein
MLIFLIIIVNNKNYVNSIYDFFWKNAIETKRPAQWMGGTGVLYRVTSVKSAAVFVVVADDIVTLAHL